MTYHGPRVPMCNHFACRFDLADALMRAGRWLEAMSVYEIPLVPCVTAGGCSVRGERWRPTKQ